MIKFMLLVIGVLSPLIFIALIILPMVIYRNIYKKTIIYGMFFGAIIGFVAGRYIYLSFFAELLYGNLSKYAIRIDALFYTGLFTSAGMISAAVASAKWITPAKKSKASQNYSRYLFALLIAVTVAMVFFIFSPIKK